MNQVIETIKSRRSVRKFKEDQIPEDVLNQIIEAGLHAPSGHNHQPWHFTVIQNQEILDDLNREAKAAALNFNDNMIQKMASNDKLHIFYNAPTAVIVSANPNAMTPQPDCGAATQNMLLAAESLGVASCWVGFVKFVFTGDRTEHYNKLLGIPEGYEIYYAVSLGYSALESANAPARKEGTVTFLK